MPNRGGEKAWDIHLRTLSNSARDSNLATDPASDPSLLQSVRLLISQTAVAFLSSTFRLKLVYFGIVEQVKKLYELCKEGNNEELVARVYPHVNKLFQRSVASLSQSRTSNGLLLLVMF